jgi:TRAP-type C4-dicarboxylate transport system permease small subunit
MTLKRFIYSYESFLKVILFIMMVALAVTVLLGVSFRFAGSALVWYDEVAAVQLAWITYYGSAYASLKGAHISVPSIFKAFPLALRKIFFVLSKLVIYGFLILLAYYGYLVLTLIGGETLVTLEWVPQTFVQSVIPVASLLFILSETLRIPEDYRNLVLQTTNVEMTGDI